MSPPDPANAPDPVGPSAPLRLVLATANRDKAAEIVAIVAESAGHALEVVERPPDLPDVEETGDTLEANARLKARAVAAASGLPALADDTGLEVDALGGRPGVRSSRFSGEHATYAQNVAKLLDELRAVGASEPSARRAKFRTVALVFFPDGSEIVGVGEVAGTIAAEAAGDHGFGYDPVFVPAEGDGRTFAQMSSGEKALVSHRGRAVRSAVEQLLARSSG